jgi:hypothetical protein
MGNRNIKSAEMKSREYALQLPSYESMGFKEKWKKAFPYHPLLDMCQIHIELEYQDFQIFRVDKRVPNFEELKRIWWRKRFRDFLRKEFRKNDRIIPKFVPPEEEFLKTLDPNYRLNWNLYKTKVLLIESKRDRFGVKKYDFEYHLRKDWILKKKYQFLMRMTGLREEPFWRQRTRRDCLDYYQKLIVWCSHWECWTIRIKYLPLLPYMYFKFWFYDYFHPELLWVH